MDSIPPARHKVLILAFNELSRDARVLRQARALATDFRVTLAGFGANPFLSEPELNIEWQPPSHPVSAPRPAPTRPAPRESNLLA